VGSLAVVAYPVLSPGDRRWIEEIRARHDPQASRIAAHVTLAFPMGAAEAPLVAHVRGCLQESALIRVTLGRAAVGADAIRGGSCAFLPVEGGSRALIAVHESLYKGILAGHGRRDIPYVPHVTVGAHPMPGECERVAKLLNDEGRVVAAEITGVHIVRLDETMAWTVAEIPLRAAPHRIDP
jgi:2'-5' RNA ligase